MKRLLYIAFVLALWLPLIAVALSPRFPAAMRGLLARTMDWNVEKDGLRRSTPLWNGAVSMYNTLAYRLGTSNNRGVAVVGKDGWVFLGDDFNRNFSQAIGRKTLSDAEVRDWSAAFRGQAAYLEQSQRAFLVVVAPAKWSVYRDKLPDWTGARPVQTSLDRLLAVRPALPMIDLRPALIAGRQHGDTFSKLNTHWTGYGAWVAWNPLADEIARRLHDRRLWRPALASMPISDERNEYDAMLGIDVPNRWTGFVPTKPASDYSIVGGAGRRAHVRWHNRTSLYDVPRATENPAAPSPRRLLVFRDSTGDEISPFLQSSFREVLQVAHALDKPSSRPDFIAAVEAYAPDLVLLVLTERYLSTPPPRPLYWRLAAAYYAKEARELGRWPGVAGAAGPMRTDGDPRLSGSAFSIDLGNMQRARTNSAVFEVRAVAEGEGGLEFAIKCSDGPGRTVRDRYHPGLNVYFLEWRADDCDGSLVLQRAAGSARVELQKVSLRQR
jgi:hypothetical protein